MPSGVETWFKKKAIKSLQKTLSHPDFVSVYALEVSCTAGIKNRILATYQYACIATAYVL